MTKKASFMLPKPFAWVDIPAGQVTLITEKGWVENYIPQGESRTFDVPAFQIAKYPVTVAQYELFMQEDGYQNSDYWTQTGWQWRREYQITLPAYWNDPEYQLLWQPDHPIVGVSWFESYAFSQWFATKTGLNINLPTEQQWQRAAQGDDGRTYPWGNKWDSQRCNNDVYGKDWHKKKAAGTMTSSVLHYAGQGDSPFDVVDMAGNMWEWCLTQYETGRIEPENINNSRVLRGGSWSVGDPCYFRCIDRNRYYPFLRDNLIGIRVTLT